MLKKTNRRVVAFGELLLRFRHPESAPIKGVSVNGKEWKAFDRERENITLKDLTGTVSVTASY